MNFMMIITVRTEWISQNMDISNLIFEIEKRSQNEVSAIGFGSYYVTEKLKSIRIDLYRHGGRYVG